VKLKKAKDTDRLIAHIFNFHLNTRQICCSPTAFVSTVGAYLIERLLDRSVFNFCGIHGNEREKSKACCRTLFEVKRT
jgi:hypothetical protein